MGKKPKMLTPRQYAELKGVAYTTVMSWLQRGKLPGAVKNDTPTGHYWEIPSTAPSPDLKPGRPPKANTETASKAGRKGSGKKP